MSKIKVQSNASGTGVFTVTSPATNTNRTITLPDGTGTLLNSDGDGSSLTNLPAASADSYFASSGLSSKDLGDGLHIKTGDSGASANANFSSLVIEDDTSSGISILSGASSDGAIYFGDSGGNDMCQIKYQHATNQLVFETNQAGALTITSDGRGLSQFTAKVWANFDGTGSASSWERDSHNVSSYADDASGIYTINFANNLANTNYATTVSIQIDSSWDQNGTLAGANAVGSCQVRTRDGAGTGYDSMHVCVIIFGD